MVDQSHEIISSLSALRPEMLPLANELANAMAKDTILRVYETYRSPQRQAVVLAKGASHAKPWHSPHQYGLALDFAGYSNGVWTWRIEPRCWDVLHNRAAEIGLSCPINWDLGHVEHPHFRSLIKLP